MSSLPGTLVILGPHNNMRCKTEYYSALAAALVSVGNFTSGKYLAGYSFPLYCLHQSP